jgi:hypothetical protein
MKDCPKTPGSRSQTAHPFRQWAVRWQCLAVGGQSMGMSALPIPWVSLRDPMWAVAES